MITVEVALFATLRIYHPQGESKSAEPFKILLSPGSTVNHLLEELKIPPEEGRTVLIDGHYREGEYILKEGEKVSIFPAIVGG